LHGFVPGRAGTKDLRSRLTFFMCVFTAVVFVLSPAVSAGGSETVRVGYYENEIFQEGARKGAMKTGYAYEYYRKLSEYTNWKYEYVYGNFAELYRMLLDGKIDLLAGLAKTKERQGLIGYPYAPMGSESYNLVKHADDDSITDDPKTLEGKIIGVLDSALADVLKRYLAERHIAAGIRLYKDYPALFAAFDAGKLDILAAEGSGAAGRNNTEILMPFGGSSYFLCVNIRRPDLLTRLNHAQSLLAVEDPNFLHSLHMKYFPKSILARAISLIEKQWLSTHDTLRIGFLENYMPFSGKTPDGQVTGIVKDIVPGILSRLGISSLKVVYSGYVSYDDMTADLSAGRIDAAFPVGGGLYFAEESGLYQTDPVTSMSSELVYRGDYSEKKTEHFAVNRNNRMQYYFILRNFPKARVTQYPSIEACLDAVLAGKVTCTTLNGLRANDILKNGKYRKLSLHHLNKTDERCFGVAVDNRGLLKLLNRGLDMLGSGYAQKISHRYTHALYSYRLKDVLRDYSGFFTSLLLAVAAVVIILLVRDGRRTRRQMAEKEAARARLAGVNRELAEVNRELVNHTETIEIQRQQESELREQLEKKQDELKDALQMTQAADRAKTTFLSNMSHDIRTPMNAIVGFTDLASSHIDDPELLKDYLATIERSSEHLLALINDVLDMSRIESGRITLNEKAESLADILHGLRDIVHADVRAKRHTFLIDATDVRNEFVYCDKLHLSRVLLNLISNAVKYTHDGGTISLRVEQKASADAERGTFEFRVKDNGIGMSDEFVATIFEPFTREENSTVSGIQGTGLGMTITKNIVETMGGSISVSTKKGEGSEFVIRLTLRLAGEKSPGPEIPELKNARTLVVSSDSDICQRIADLLRKFGMRPEWCLSYTDAAARAEDSLRQGDPVRVCIADSQDLSGIETARRLRACAGKDASVFILTADDWSEIKKEARDAGVTGFIPRTLFASDWEKVLRRFCGKADHGQTDSAEPAFSLKGKKVLMVDDSKLNLKIGVLLLQERGMTVDTASNGQLAVDTIREKGTGFYDFILMDVQMPVMNGYEATAILRKLPGGDKLKIIAFSANAFAEDREKSLKAGMNGHINKPLKIDALVEEFARVSKKS